MPVVEKLKDPWLLAVWPGMGGVAISAGYYLMAKLGMHLLLEFPATEFFELEQVEVKDGLKAGELLVVRGAEALREGAPVVQVPARPVPGFLLEPHEVQVIQFLLQQLRGRFSEKGIFGDLIDNFMPI